MTLFTYPMGVGVARERLQKDFDWQYNDWGVNALPKGAATMEGVPVERYPADQRDWRLFDQVNLRIMRGERATEPEARVYVEESIRSRALALPSGASGGRLPLTPSTTAATCAHPPS